MEKDGLIQIQIERWDCGASALYSQDAFPHLMHKDKSHVLKETRWASRCWMALADRTTMFIPLIQAPKKADKQKNLCGLKKSFFFL